MKPLKLISASFLILFFLVFNSCQEDEFTPLNESEMDTPQLKAGSTSVLADLKTAIQNFISSGVLSNGNGNALISKYENALKSLKKGNSKAAENQVKAIINQVESFINTGKLTEIQGKLLLKIVISKDIRDGQIYPFKKIGNHIWMTKNMNYKTSTGSFAFNNNLANASISGRLYNWAAAMTACPAGWHLSTHAEWKQLEIYLGMNPLDVDNFGPRGESILIPSFVQGVGVKLKAISGWNIGPYFNGNGTDVVGFTALPGGRFGRDPGSPSGTPPDFHNALDGYWWTSTDFIYSSLYAHVHAIGWEDTGVFHGASNKSTAFFSVRCVMN